MAPIQKRRYRGVSDPDVVNSNGKNGYIIKLTQPTKGVFIEFDKLQIKIAPVVRDRALIKFAAFGMFKLNLAIKASKTARSGVVVLKTLSPGLYTKPTLLEIFSAYR